MKIILVSKWSLDIEQYNEFKMSVLISPSKILISSCWVTFFNTNPAAIVDYLLYRDSTRSDYWFARVYSLWHAHTPDMYTLHLHLQVHMQFRSAAVKFMLTSLSWGRQMVDFAEASTSELIIQSVTRNCLMI